jgi:Ca-activated chloride channel homolog
MAGRPSRPRCAPVARWYVGLLVLGLLAAPLGCNKEREPVFVAKAPEPKADAKSASVVTYVEGVNDAEDRKPAKPWAAAAPAPAVPPGGVFGLAGGSAPGNQAPANQFGGGNMVGQLFQGGGGALGAFGGGFGGGALGFGGGNGGQFGFQGGRQFFDPTQPPDSRALDMSAERYQHFEDNPFKAVRNADALSTISTAVDTAAYSNARARINEGKLPAKDAVRVADFVNYFPYAYAAPKNADPVAFHLELAPCPWEAKHHLLRVGLKAKVIDKDQMPARNLVFLIDTSGSMEAPNRLPLVQESLRLLVEQLSARDRVSIVTYAGDAGLRLPPTPGDQKDKILEVVTGLSAGGSTNGEGGIQTAYDQAVRSFIKDGVNRVILATDGDFNVGVSDDAQLVRLIEEKRKTGVYLTVLGFGMGNLQDAKLEQLAHHGNGHYAYIDSLDEAKKVFVEQGGALVTVAKDVKLQVEFNPAKVSAYRLIGYENRLLTAEDFRNDAKDAGDMGSGHTCTALYEVVPTGEKAPTGEVEPLKYQTKTELTDAAKSGEWLTVRMRYKHPETDRASEVSSVLAASGLAKEPSADLRMAAAAAAFGMVLRDSEYRGDADFDKVVGWAKPAVGPDPGGHRAEFVRLVEKAKGVTEKPKAGAEK